MITAEQRQMFSEWFDAFPKGSGGNIHVTFKSGLTVHLSTNGYEKYNYTLSHRQETLQREKASRQVFFIELNDFIKQIEESEF